MGPDAMILVFECWVSSQSFHSPLLPLKRFFSSSSVSASGMVSFAYLRLLIFLLAILIPACDLSSLAFCMMSCAYKLHKQGDNIQPWDTPFPIWNQSIISCLVLTVASWPTHRFLRRQVRWSGIPPYIRIINAPHRLNGHGFGWTPGVGDGQGGLACCGSWGSQKVGHDWATELNWMPPNAQILGVLFTEFWHLYVHM